MIDGSVLPIAWTGVAPSARIAGVETTAPPTPNIPESTPVKNPAIRTRMVCRGSDKNHDTTQGPADTLSDMANDLQLRGVYIPLITPFAADGSVALDAVTLLCHEYLDAGATGIVALGTTGESTALSAERSAGSSTRAPGSAPSGPPSSSSARARTALRPP